MNENIELHSFISNNVNEDDIQEYHEIKQETRFDNTDTTSIHSPKPLNQYDFFIQHDSNTGTKKLTKKKKAKKKENSVSLMDVISSELAATSVPIKENVITYVDTTKEQQNSYLENNPRTVLRKSFFTESENGWSRKTQVNLRPIFPRVLENVTMEEVSIPVEYVDPTLFEDIIDQNIDNVEDEATKFLDITLKDLKYNHHHHFSLEKLLFMKLVEYYNEHENTNRLIQELLKDIQVSRETKNNLKKDLIKVKSNKKEDIRFDQIIRKYTGAMLQLKEKYIETVKNNKEIVHKIMSLWSDIEIVREKYKRVECPYVLHISKEALDEKEFEKEWNANFNTEFTDMLEKIEFDYVTEYIEYRDAKNECTSYKKPLKPKLDIDESAIKREVENLVNNVVTKERICLVLKRNDTHLKNNKPSNSFHFKIYVDEVFVGESEHYNSDDFQTEFSEQFSVQILPNNKNLQINLLENDREVSSFEINFHQVRKTNSTSDFAIVKFVYSDTIIEPNRNFVGSGYSIKDIASANKIRLKSSSMFKEILNTNSEVNIKIGWNDKLEQNSTETIKSSMEVGRQIKRLLHGIDEPDLDTLLGIISKIYELDINDTKMIETIRNLSKTEIRNDDTFPIDENNPDLIRLKLLHLRNTGQFNSIENNTVPLYASQISTEQLDCLQNTREKDFDMEYLNVKEMEMDPIELQRFIGAKYLQRLNKNMLKNLNEYLMKKTHKDVVRDFNLSLRSLFSNQSNLITLSTMPNSTKHQMLKESLNKEQEIHVTVLRAFNLLDRSSTVLEEDHARDDDYIAGFKVRPLRPYVRVLYKGVTAQSVTAIGSHPTWNHTLKLNTKLQPLTTLHINVFDEFKENIAEGYSEDESNKTVHYRYYNKWLGTLQVPLHTVLSMGTLRGTFKITTPPLLLGYEHLHVKEATSLIPEIAQLMKKDTTFITLQITTSVSNFAGLNAYNQPLPSSIEDDYLIKHLNNFVTEYTNEFPTRNISLTFIDSAGRNKSVTQFLQPIPLPERDLLPRNPRGESAVSKSSGISRSSSSSGRRREIDLERVSQEERESVYSVYEGDNALTKMINATMRYVSLIPSYEVTESHVVTLLGLEVLKVLHGSPLDHTILLASYFIYLGIKCWVAIGLGFPRGPSSYVLIKYDLTTRRIVLDNDQLFRSRGFLNKNDGYTWYVCDASSGEKCELRDVGCPMKTVEYVFDNENIWVNIQASQDCENISFDFSRSSDWQPVFDKTVFVMKQPVVKDVMLYSPACSVEALRVALETRIKGKVQKWRSHMKTIWNRYCSGLLRDMLPQWEFWAFNQTSHKPGLSQKLKQLMVTYKIFGFPLNMPYVNSKAVISAVKSTGLHATDDPHVEFALGVEVYAYPNNVISVWVFLVSITRI